MEGALGKHSGHSTYTASIHISVLHQCGHQGQLLGHRRKGEDTPTQLTDQGAQLRLHHKPLLLDHGLARERVLHVASDLGEVEGEEDWLGAEVPHTVLRQQLLHLPGDAVHPEVSHPLPLCGRVHLPHHQHLPVVDQHP